MIYISPELNILNHILDRSKRPKLPYTIYARQVDKSTAGGALIYISPKIPNATKIANFLNQRIGSWTVIDGALGISHNYWIAFHEKLVNQNPKLCAKVCLFVERALHSLIYW